MTRPRKNEHTREKLLKEGLLLLSEHGYHGTGLKKILDTVNVPKGSFYNYFKSKEIFVAEIIKHYNFDVIKWMDNYIASTNDDPVTIIRNICDIGIIELEKNGMNGCLVGNLVAEIGSASELCQSEIKHGADTWNSKIEVLITDAQQKGMIRTDLPALTLSEMFWSIWQGGMLKMKIDGNTDHLKEIVSTIFDHLFRPGIESKK